ncbi:MAG TPA: hypothetical protein VGS79_02135 [Puia sp.]|nr:hypothetical protein [Puia sp.]
MNGKRLSLATVISLGMLGLWGLGSCSKNNSTSYTTDGTLTATVNGAAYSAKSYVVAGYLTTYGQVIVQGDSIVGRDTTEIQVAMPYIPAVNAAVYTDSTQFAGLTYKVPGKEYDAYYGLGFSHGVVTLSSADTVNHKVAGSFSGVLYNIVNSNDSIVITNGAFTSSYQVQ